MKQFAYGAVLCALALAACQKTANDTTAANDTMMNNATANDMAASGATTSAIDAAFVTDAIKGDNAEIAIGELAAAKGGTQAVKDLGKTLATDHGAHKDKLVALASANGIAVPDEKSPEGQANLDKLSELSGAAFDKAFKQAMIDSHNKGIAKNEKQAASGDAQTAALAKETLPTLRKHLGMVEAL
jgi:putative membrane protein